MCGLLAENGTSPHESCIRVIQQDIVGQLECLPWFWVFFRGGFRGFFVKFLVLLVKVFKCVCLFFSLTQS